MKKQAGFTLIELLIVIFVISTGLLVIIQGLIESHKYISESAQRTIALNLAKEGIEAVYNLRNTNWRRYSDKKNECWLARSDCKDSKDTGLLTDATTRIFGLQSGDICTYDRTEKKYKLNQTAWPDFFPVSKESLGSWHDTEGRFEKFQQKPRGDENYQLIKYGGKWLPLGMISGRERGRYTDASIAQNDQRHICGVDFSNPVDETMGKYYRAITIHGVFEKETRDKLNCKTTPDRCKSDTAKELRFCSTVFYTQPYQGVVNLCSILTNFERDEQ